VNTATAEKLASVRRRGASLALGFAGLFILLSLLTFSPADVTGNVWPPPGSTQNVCGQVGAGLAQWLMLHFGYAAYVAVALAAGFAARCLLKRDVIDAWMSVFGALTLLVSTAAAAELSGVQPASLPGGGGVVGIAVSDALLAHLGQWGAWLGTLLLIAIGAVLLSVDELVAWLWRHAGGHVAAWWRSSREAIVAATARQPATQPAAGPAPARTSRPEPPPEPASKPPIRSGGAPLREPAPAAVAERDEPDEPAPVADEPEPNPAAEPEADSGAEPEPEPKEVPPIRSAKTKTRAIDKIAAIPDRVCDADYELPPLALLEDPEHVDESTLEQMIRENSEILERTLSEFGIGARVVGIEKGPQVTRYELQLAAGIKLTRVTNLADDIAMAVKAPSVRVVAPIPGRSTVGIEVPNALKEVVRLVELMTCDEFLRRRDKLVLPVLMGKDASGTPVISDLTRMPHLLIAGATGSGKSVCMSSIIVTLLMVHRPEDLRLILVDPKMVEMGMFEGLPHLLTPVVTDMKRAPHVLEWACKQMDERYDQLARVGVRHCTQYNKLGEEGIRKRLGPDFDYEDNEIPFHMPYIVIIVDELADMMMTASKEVEVSITRLAQKSRAVGIHIILATQRPSVDVITGLIKSNLPTRVSFQVTSKVDSRTILDRNGAEKLLGSGDLLFVPPGTSDLVRVQGTYCSDSEIKAIADFAREQGEPAYRMNVKQLGRDEEATGKSSRTVPPVPAGPIIPEEEPPATSPLEDYSPDDLYDDACRVVLQHRRGSVSLLQRKLEIGYTRAARLVEMMAAEGIVGGYKGSKARQVVMTLREWEEMRGIPPEERLSTDDDDDGAFVDDDDEDDAVDDAA
jgi:S-DNA-T family DNA segregation ATPase FtsK/SpoIIIE